MKKSNKWIAGTTFVVLTMIFWTIGFISLQWYSSDARNSKRLSDIWSIQSAISTQLAQWQSILSFVNDNNDNKIDPSVLSIWWRKSTSISDYNAWFVNYMALPVKKEDFIDPDGNAYVIWVTNRVNWKYEITASIEQGSSYKVARVVWTYNSRNKTSINCKKVDNNNKQVSFINSMYINMFNKWDFVIIKTDNWIINAKIEKISVDGTTLTLNSVVNNPISIELAESESRWLIDRKDADWKSWSNYVTDGSYNLPY